MLGKYDDKINEHLVRCRLNQQYVGQKPKGPKGRGSNLTFL